MEKDWHRRKQKNPGTSRYWNPKLNRDEGTLQELCNIVDRRKKSRPKN